MFTKFFILINIGLSSYILFLLLKEQGGLPGNSNNITKSAETENASTPDATSQPKQTPLTSETNKTENAPTPDATSQPKQTPLTSEPPVDTPESHN